MTFFEVPEIVFEAIERPFKTSFPKRLAVGSTAMETSMDVVTPFQFSLVYNAFSFTLAAMAAATAFLWLSRSQVAPAYRTALTISGLVTGIAAYHYYRIFESWNASYTLEAGIVSATGFAFNDAYRYVDWLLTVPLLLIELVLIMRLSRGDVFEDDPTGVRRGAHDCSRISR